jgi:photosystem II stability/assembly factor-like uncharacterized protein
VSRDGGLTWESRPLEGTALQQCGWSYLRPDDVLVPDPSDDARVWFMGTCGRAGAVLRSDDRGLTWASQFTAEPREQVYLARSVGGVPSDRRYLLGHTRGKLLSPETYGCCSVSRLLRSDDGGVTWTEHGRWTNEGTPEAQNMYANKGKELGAAIFDPSAPDTVYVGLTFEGGGVMVSRDGGDSWTELGRKGIGDVRDLALGIDGAYLFAATDTGVYRLRLH